MVRAPANAAVQACVCRFQCSDPCLLCLTSCRPKCSRVVYLKAVPESSSGQALLCELCHLSPHQAALIARTGNGRLADAPAAGRLARELLLLYGSFAAVGKALQTHPQYAVAGPGVLEEVADQLQRLGVPATSLAAICEAQPLLLTCWGREMQARLCIWARIAVHMGNSSISGSDYSSGGSYSPGSDRPAAQPYDLLDALLALEPRYLVRPSVAELAARLGFMHEKRLRPPSPVAVVAPLEAFLAACGTSPGAWSVYKNYAWPQSELQQQLAAEYGWYTLSFSSGGGSSGGGSGSRVVAAQPSDPWEPASSDAVTG